MTTVTHMHKQNGTLAGRIGLNVLASLMSAGVGERLQRPAVINKYRKYRTYRRNFCYDTLVTVHSPWRANEEDRVDAKERTHELPTQQGRPVDALVAMKQDVDHPAIGGDQRRLECDTVPYLCQPSLKIWPPRASISTTPCLSFGIDGGGGGRLC